MSRKVSIEEAQEELKQMIVDAPWIRYCWACERHARDWEMMVPWRVGKRTDKPVPLCIDCAQQERDLRQDKAG